DSGEYYPIFTVSDGDLTGELEITIILNDAGDPEIREIIVTLMRGWNIMSINVSPDDEFRYDQGRYEDELDVVRMMEQLRQNDENHHIMLMKNELGQFYAPSANGFNNIPYWDLTQAYQVKVDEDVEPAWEGEPIAPDTDIPIEFGWNLIPYFPTYELTMTSPEFFAIHEIVDNVLLMKNQNGQFAAPRVPFSNMPPLLPGEGYQIKVNEDVTLNYPPEDQEIAAVERDMTRYAQNHWNNINPTDGNMSILITSLSGKTVYNRDQIAAFDANGRMVGVGMFDADGRCGLAVWGDDPSTDVVDGMQKSEAFTVRFWDSDQASEIDLKVCAIQYGTGLKYEQDGFAALDVEVSELSVEEFYLSKAYPNPFNAMTMLSYGLPEDGRVTVRIYDLSGRLVGTLVDSEQTSGHYTVEWDGRDSVSGIYLVKMDALSFSVTQKLLLMK
ncbi:MAG: T9SS type A sorting domain-containing protein, partial [Candidatus Electryoneaceae bacterium]|nr:T9SS type A sorting domain-containing protein [Candidatus Electryoneaceae bacterium]